MDDLISRKAAVDSICRTVCDNPEICESPCDEIKVLEIMPSAQPVAKDINVPVKDCISRQDAISAFWELNIELRPSCIDAIIDMLKGLPSAQSTMSQVFDGDTINRQSAIDEIKALYEWHDTVTEDRTIDHLKRLPSAQPETHDKRTETHACDYINRKDAIDALRTCYDTETVTMDDGDEYINYGDAIGEIEQLPSAQPEQTNSWYINSWCNNCKEYDTENKCCPRYNRVIKQTLDDAYRHGETEAEARYHAQQRWIPFKRRKPTEEEGTAFDYIMDCKCPEDGQNILVSINIQGHEPVQYDTFYGGGGEECCLESGYELVEEATAWMPLPEPYREEGD